MVSGNEPVNLRSLGPQFGVNSFIFLPPPCCRYFCLIYELHNWVSSPESSETQRKLSFLYCTGEVTDGFASIARLWSSCFKSLLCQLFLFCLVEGKSIVNGAAKNAWHLWCPGCDISWCWSKIQAVAFKTCFQNQNVLVSNPCLTKSLYFTYITW